MSASEPPNPFNHTEPHVSDFNRPVVEEFRANRGRVDGPLGGDLLLLTTVGARSGREHTTPLGYFRDGERLLVVASAGGAPRHPDWYRNLLAHPAARVEVGAKTFGAIAVPLEGAERDRLFAEIVRRDPGYGDYQARTGRTIPVVALERLTEDDGAAASLADKLVEIHTWLRGQLHHVRAETDAYLATRAEADERPPVGLGLQIRQHCLAFCEGLHFHHTAEDAGVLPALEQQHPELKETVERLRAEHRAVERVRGELVALLAEVSTADPDRFRAELDRMAGDLEAHLDYEEEQLLPLLAAVPFPPGGPQPSSGAD
ncbi:nitroreductase family deazaflavin-dependent oxidoreductase [Thermobifida halotolerans]|uniref:Nitroreductase family deazaflavin-dependent oxidoreductase n=1 Tax=Thermobifida halotolerans TaxID=483545 RepID=A0A399G751_9ACTN|nr:nitroreductase/quinone reductase family protein [Thermobifida halotolerans]UOE20952.1 nitroreductase family deazaflavin-dependent oxidoreductase [Thermobifida halotolerans]